MIPPNNDLNVAPFHVTNCLDMAKKHLTPKAVKSLEKTVSQAIIGDNKTYLCLNLMIRVLEKDIPKAVEQLSLVLNDLAEKELIYSFLQDIEISCVELYRAPLENKQFLVFTFPLVPSDQLEQIKKDVGIFLKEDEIPAAPENVKMEIPDGICYAAEHVSIVSTMVNKSAKETIEDIGRIYLAVLPKGTEFSYQELGVSGFSIPFELKFTNRLFKTIKTLDSQWFRHIEEIDGRVEQYNVMTGINYYDKDGKKLFSNY